jgi:D-sedoheptulose 7-phosphate isomerase
LFVQNKKEYRALIATRFEESRRVYQELTQNNEIQEAVATSAEKIVEALKSGGRVLFCGNGGSAADAQHLAAELSGRFLFDRPALDAEALHVNTSYVTAIGNDYSYDEIFARAVKAKGRRGDVLLGLSTSGNSKNVLKAMEAAKEKGMFTVGLTGKSGGEMLSICDLTIRAPSQETPRIQEAHILMGHTICELVENILFADK